MKNPLGVSPSKGYQGTTRGKEYALSYPLFLLQHLLQQEQT